MENNAQNMHTLFSKENHCFNAEKEVVQSHFALNSEKLLKLFNPQQF